MTLLQLRYAITVADSRSMNQAAQKLFISQPSLSSAIRELEDEVGIEIFRRTNRGIQVTPDGEEFLQYARRIIREVDEIEELYRNARTKKQRFSACVPRASCAITRPPADSRMFSEPPDVFTYAVEPPLVPGETVEPSAARSAMHMASRPISNPLPPVSII